MQVYPVNLLLKNKRCLIVGGGKVAARKVDNLLEIGADITVIAQEPCKHICNYSDTGVISLFERNFDFDDLNGFYLIYIATSDRALNLKIAKEAQNRHILFCLVDRNWHESDFITPAVVRRDNIVVSVSTGGIACRKSRLIKDNIARHIDMIEQTQLLVIGTDFHYLIHEKRAPFHLTGDSIHRTAEKILTLSGVHEFTILNTCNRIEIILAVAISQPLLEMLKMILGFNTLKESEFYTHSGYEAFEHLCLVTAGIFSQTPGENHITSQFKEAFRFSATHNYGGYLMQSLHDSVIYVARELRNNLIAGYSVVELEVLVAESIEKYAEINLDSESELNILILGTGKMGRALISVLNKKNYNITWCYNSKIPESTVAEQVEIKHLSDIKELILKADIVVSALSVEHLILTYEICQGISDNLLMIDLGIPPNIDSDVIKVSGISLITLNDLKSHSLSNLETQLIEPGKEIIETHRKVYEKFKKSFINGHQGQ